MAQTDGDAPRELFLIDGNSLAYRAFFALPESIATSDGRPTNAIFGFASMLVKILTDYGEVPTVVVWDAGMSGRKELSADYKAQRSSRPDLLKLQWPHLRPLVEAFGYRNISVEGFEADDVIAALVEQAREREHPGDGGDRRPRRVPARRRRRADHDHEPRDHRHQGLRHRGRDRALRHPAREDPRLHRPQGRHERQHPRRPRHRRQDRLRAAPALRRPRDRARQRRRDLRRQAQAEPDRARRRGAALEAAGDDGPRRPDRPRPRGRAHEGPRPRQPAHGLPRLGAARPAAAARGGAVRGRGGGDPAPRGGRGAHDARQDRRHRRRRGAAAGRRAVPRRRRPRGRRGRADPARAALALRRLRGRRRTRWPARSTTRPSWSRPPATARWSPTTPRRSATVPGNLVFDTQLAAYLLDPARRGFPLDELCRGARPRRHAEDENAARAVLVHDLAAQQRDAARRARADRPAQRHRAAARARPARGGEGRHQARHQAARGGREPHPHGRRRTSSARSGTWPARSS